MSPLTLVAVRLVYGTLGLLVVVPFKPEIRMLSGLPLMQPAIGQTAMGALIWE
jgi:hypothetical protein